MWCKSRLLKRIARCQILGAIVRSTHGYIVLVLTRQKTIWFHWAAAQPVSTDIEIEDAENFEDG